MWIKGSNKTMELQNYSTTAKCICAINGKYRSQSYVSDIQSFAKYFLIKLNGESNKKERKDKVKIKYRREGSNTFKMKIKMRNEFLNEEHNQGWEMYRKKRWTDFSRIIRISIGKRANRAEFLSKKGIRAGRPAETP